MPPERIARACACGEHGFMSVGKAGVAFVSPEDIDTAAQRLWYLKSGYAAAEINGRTARLHRVLIGIAAGADVDHADRDKLNNRRENLRRATRSQNCRNRTSWGGSHFKGVDFVSRDGLFRARIGMNGRVRHLGLFSSAVDAARAYDAAAVAQHGDFALTNARLGLYAGAESCE